MLVLNNYAPDVRVHKEAKTMASAGYEVTVFALWQEGLPDTEIMEGYQLKRIHLKTRKWRNRLIAPLVKYLEFFFHVQSESKKHPADIYHANEAITLPAAWLAASRNRAKLVYDSHELETDREFMASQLSRFYGLVWSLPERALIRQADAVITVSEGIAGEIARRYDIQKPLVVMNCPEKVHLFRTNRLREELGIPENMKIALYQGGIAPERGIEQFFDAVQRIPGLAGVAMGDGPLLSELRSRLHSGEWERVYLPGRVQAKELPSYTASADLGIVLNQGKSLSYQYSLPNKLFENLQAGNPVIGSNLPEIARIIREYQVGEVVDQTDPESIAAGLRRLLEDPAYYEQTRRNALRASETLNWEREGARLVELYRCLGESPAKPEGSK
ncbi:MAG: glycosyltransferase family 4 protein [Omnitrophica WOR_2 bacterium]